MLLPLLLHRYVCLSVCLSHTGCWMYLYTGLCRTCEIFGVSKLVMSSLSYVDDRTFENLSVSAHKWIHIDEVCRLRHWRFQGTVPD